ncbi:PAS domain S-box-containing protein [Paraburkholderia sp. HC6.4b]|uniref:response regulator n=1 Tax=unclassified Paraburkholderia TaxID=2615204 RepID=UPI001613521E|nr:MULTISPECIES: response regulator [unclassified Paraburkholderia]MBB5413528.1 PAS domain S-box-containing protein [Paraburkholderia sp. HC6.4b]MBB5455849.1 PAS domain S-box-containing protein [Paraburkholderia sp. Kb1A]MBC8725324.1 response regulator [Paraburkholderia sp. 31.1]
MSHLAAPVAYTGTILIVDDTPGNLGVVVDSLEARGIRVLVALDGIEALERAAFSQPDVILLDVKMPGIDGFETCRRLKRDERTRDIAVIFMTSLMDNEDRVEGFLVGGVDYVTKPLRVDEMVARVGVHLELRVMHKQVLAQNRQLLAEVAVRKETEAALSQARDDLERRVALRTEELARANANLRAQIDERRRADARLQASEARFRAIVETSPVPLCITSMPDGHILYTNPPLRELFGMDEGLSANIADFYAERGERERLIEHLRTKGGLRNTEIQFRRQDGTRFWAMATARAATYDDSPAIYVGLNDITGRKQMEQELVESREQQRELSAYMEAIREEERKRIAMEIHDELGQLLTALKMDVSLLKMRIAHDAEATKKADDMRQLVEGTISMVRNVASHLRPAALNFGIVSALEWLVDEFNRRNAIACELRIEGGEPTLSDAHATALFRIAQASLTNVARHAAATRVEVTLVSTASQLLLHVRDDGCGFDQQVVSRNYSYGLLGMNERARLIGGSLSIDSSPGAGTMVSIHIPLDGGART